LRPKRGGVNLIEEELRPKRGGVNLKEEELT